MSLLAGTSYDPGTAASVSTASLLAMTAIDTTNLRLTFTAPANGTVFVRVSTPVTGATTYPAVHLGVLDGATVRMRMCPFGSLYGTNASSLVGLEACGLVTGLTPGQSYTWDAAYGVDIVLASTVLKWGGPDDASGADAWGAIDFEIWSTEHLLAGTLYDPSSAVSKGVVGLAKMTAFDTTNLRLTFTAPPSGLVMWRVATVYTASGTAPSFIGFLGALESATVVGRAAPIMGAPQTFLAGSRGVIQATGIASVSAGSHTWDAAFAVNVAAGTSGALKYGGPNDTTTNNAWGGFVFEIWTTSGGRIPRNPAINFQDPALY